MKYICMFIVSLPIWVLLLVSMHNWPIYTLLALVWVSAIVYLLNMKKEIPLCNPIPPRKH